MIIEADDLLQPKVKPFVADTSCQNFFYLVSHRSLFVLFVGCFSSVVLSVFTGWASGEAQKIDRVMETFAKRFVETNTSVFFEDSGFRFDRKTKLSF